MKSNSRGASSGKGKFSSSKGGGKSEGRPRSSKPASRDGRSSSKPKGLRFGTSSTGGSKEDRPYREEKPRFERTDRPASGDKPFRKKYDGDSASRPAKPYGERNERPDRRESSRDEKPRFDRNERSSGGEKPFRKKYDTDSIKRTERPYNDRKERGERPERKQNSGEEKRFSREDLKPRASREGEDREKRPARTTDKRNVGGKGPGSFGSKPSAPRKFDDKKGGKKPDGFVKKNFLKPKGRNAEDLTSTNGEIRLNRFLSISGIASRREADELIAMGLVTVNGKVVTEMGHRVKASDEVTYNGTKIRAEKKVYVLLNKPKGYITTVEDPKARKTVMDLIGGHVKERVYPVGRLDRSTMGVLLFTNDGDMAKKLTHPANGASKIYMVTLDKPVTKGDLDKISKGLELEDGIAPVDAISYIEGKGKNNIGIEIHIGRNRIVRRIFETLGYEVTKLDRTSIAGLTKKNLSRGQWRYLTDKEVNFLKML